MRKVSPFLVLLLSISLSYAQNISSPGPQEYILETPGPCLSPEDRQYIISHLNENVALLQKEGLLPHQPMSRMTPSFDWPVRKAAGLNYNSFYGISNFVDQDPTTGVKDFDCGSRTYDGHKGLDIFSWPFPWYLVENDLIEVVAAEAGTIIGKFDGNEDDHCSFLGTWNAVYIQHSDGSVAWYGHLKKNSLTAKTIGQAVAKGEFLGIMASSGRSTGPHLHFEVYKATPYLLTNLIDPYQGSCNSLNTDSWWAAQKDYREPTLNAVLTHDDVPEFGCPDTAEDPHFASSFPAGERVYLGTYYQDLTKDDQIDLRLIAPEGSLYTSWSVTATATFSSAFWYWSFDTPSDLTNGTWTFEVDYRSQTIGQSFEITAALPVELTHFGGSLIDDQAHLEWSTATEINNAGFEVEHSFNGTNWSVLGFVEGHGNTVESRNYQFLHSSPSPGNNYYRLRQVDFDGGFEYTDVVVIKRVGQQALALFPNPVSHTLTIYGELDENATLTIMDIAGAVKDKRRLDQNKLDLSHLPQGLYLFLIETGGKQITKRVVRQR